MSPFGGHVRRMMPDEKKGHKPSGDEARDRDGDGRGGRRTLAELRIPSRYGVTLSRILRYDMPFVPNAETKLRPGDQVYAVGPPDGIERFMTEAGHRARALHETDLASLTVALLAGLLVLAGCGEEETKDPLDWATSYNYEPVQDSLQTEAVWLQTRGCTTSSYETALCPVALS